MEGLSSWLFWSSCLDLVAGLLILPVCSWLPSSSWNRAVDLLVGEVYTSALTGEHLTIYHADFSFYPAVLFIVVFTLSGVIKLLDLWDLHRPSLETWWSYAWLASSGFHFHSFLTFGILQSLLSVTTLWLCGIFFAEFIFPVFFVSLTASLILLLGNVVARMRQDDAHRHLLLHLVVVAAGSFLYVAPWLTYLMPILGSSGSRSREAAWVGYLVLSLVLHFLFLLPSWVLVVSPRNDWRSIEVYLICQQSLDFYLNLFLFVALVSERG